MSTFNSRGLWQGWEITHWFSERIVCSLICSLLVSVLSDSLMVAHFDERPERIAHIAHFWWETWVICSHRSIKKREWANRSLKKEKNLQKMYKKIRFYHFSQIFLRESLIRSFIMSNLICHELPEQFAHCRSFDMRDLSDLLTVAHLSWAIWANCSQSLIWFERWANEWIPTPWSLVVLIIRVRADRERERERWRDICYKERYRERMREVAGERERKGDMLQNVPKRSYSPFRWISWGGGGGYTWLCEPVAFSLLCNCWHYFWLWHGVYA